MNKKRIINKKHIPTYHQCRKWGKIKVYNFACFNEQLDEMNYPIWVLKKQKIGIKKPFIEYIGKMTFKDYLAIKPKKYQYTWACILHAGTCSDKITNWEYYKNIEKHLQEFKEHAKNYKRENNNNVQE